MLGFCQDFVTKGLTELLTLNISDSSNVVLSGQHKLVVDDPVGFVIQASRRVQLNDLIIFDRQVMAGSFQMSDLHEESLNQSLANVNVVILGCELGAGALQVESVHDTSELLTNIVG